MLQRLIQLKALALLGLAAMLVGCGTHFEPTAGVVTLDGAPLQGADVVFVPASFKGTNSIGTTDDSGRYELKYIRNESGAMLGQYVVVISKKKILANEREVETLPTKYNEDSELTANVVQGAEAFNFDLQSK